MNQRVHRSKANINDKIPDSSINSNQFETSSPNLEYVYKIDVRGLSMCSCAPMYFLLNNFTLSLSGLSFLITIYRPLQCKISCRIELQSFFICLC